MNEARFQRLSALIIDDNPSMRELIRAMLGAFGVTNMMDAREGEHAMTRMEDFHFDLIITDWVMEPMDGIEFTRWLRTSANSPDPYLPVIMVTGHTEQRRVVEARDAGVNEFIAKPATAKTLLQKMIQVIEHPRPYVRTQSFFGPDRRRRSEPFKGEDRRAPPDD